MMQLVIFIKRDILSKISNLQYLLINLLEAPLLAVILTVIIKYTSDTEGKYIFMDNDNIPPYIFMSIVIALFIGLSVSAEEIFRDRKILKRESFLNLSRSSYLFSKIGILFLLSAFQTLTFVLVGNTILGVHGTFFQYWIVLFGVSCFANILGLNISSAFNSAVTIYILIPLLVIPQMVLGGAMFSFDKLNSLIGAGQRNTPVIADVMVSRWAYEAIAVSQFKDNPYQKHFYELEKLESKANYKQVYFIPELEKILMEAQDLQAANTPESQESLRHMLAILRTEIRNESELFDDIKFENTNSLFVRQFSPESSTMVYDFLDELKSKYVLIYNIVNKKQNELIKEMEQEMGKDEYIELFRGNYNDFLANLLKKSTNQNKILRGEEELIQIIDPVFLEPEKTGFASLRAHFYAPFKYLFGYQVDTLLFNLGIIWLFSIGFYITLYYDILGRLLRWLSK